MDRKRKCEKCGKTDSYNYIKNLCASCYNNKWQKEHRDRVNRPTVSFRLNREDKNRLVQVAQEMQTSQTEAIKIMIWEWEGHNG